MASHDWTNAIISTYGTYQHLQHFEGQSVLVDESIASLRKLIAHGKTYESMKNYTNSPRVREAAPSSTSRQQAARTQQLQRQHRPPVASPSLANDRDNNKPNQFNANITTTATATTTSDNDNIDRKHSHNENWTNNSTCDISPSDESLAPGSFSPMNVEQQSFNQSATLNSSTLLLSHFSPAAATSRSLSPSQINGTSIHGINSPLAVPQQVQRINLAAEAQRQEALAQAKQGRLAQDNSQQKSSSTRRAQKLALPKMEQEEDYQLEYPAAPHVQRQALAARSQQQQQVLSIQSNQQQQQASKREARQPDPCKPDKSRYIDIFKQRITIGDQAGRFVWNEESNNDTGSASQWKEFASTVAKGWVQNMDTELDALDKHIMNPSVAAANGSSCKADVSSKAPIKFNTMPRSYRLNGKLVLECRSNDTNGEVDNWSVIEECPDIMQIAMNNTPIRKNYGPRIENPFLDDGYDDDEDESDEKDHADLNNACDQDDICFAVIKQELPKKKKKNREGVAALPTFKDSIFLYGYTQGHSELSVLKLATPEHLNMIHIPPPGTDYTVVIGYHYVYLGGNMILKALQLYLSSGESYTAIIEQTCLIKLRDTLKDTKFGQLITDPSIKRVCWNPGFIQEEMKKKLGFTIGPCVDLFKRANHNRQGMTLFSSLNNALGFYLKDWPDKPKYTDAEEEFEAIQPSGKKFACFWDRDRLPGAALTYCALHGLANYCLYLKTLEVIRVPDDAFRYNP